MVKVDPRSFAWPLALAMLGTTPACGNTPAPEPTKVTKSDPLARVPELPERTGPFRNPRLDAPEEREGDQLPAAELTDVITRAREAKAAGDDNKAIGLLRKCANKLQQSGLCEGELALIILPLPQFKAEAQYYIDEACASNDPGADADFYVTLAEAAAKKGRYKSAASAYRQAIDRGKDDAATWNRYAGALQSSPETLPQAAEALARAYERDPKNHDYLFDRAVLLAQMFDHGQAVRLMKDYLDKTRGEDPARDARIKARISELEAEASSAKKASKDPEPAAGADEAKPKAG